MAMAIDSWMELVTYVQRPQQHGPREVTKVRMLNDLKSISKWCESKMHLSIDMGLKSQKRNNLLHNSVSAYLVDHR